jgi:hypothetical protein
MIKFTYCIKEMENLEEFSEKMKATEKLLPDPHTYEGSVLTVLLVPNVDVLVRNMSSFPKPGEGPVTLEYRKQSGKWVFYKYTSQ